MTKSNTPILLSHKQATASFAAGSVFLTTITLPTTSGECRACWIDYSAATTNTLRVTIDDGTASVLNQNLVRNEDATVAVVASTIVGYKFTMLGGNNYSFSQSSAGTIALFNLFALE